LSLLLVFAQHGAVLHELGHLSHGDRGDAPALHAHQPADSTCPTCEAFAQVANPASGAAHTLATCAPVFLAVTAPSSAFAGADAPTPRNRGPPQA
jgi:hypothetical protein